MEGKEKQIKCLLVVSITNYDNGHEPPATCVDGEGQPPPMDHAGMSDKGKQLHSDEESMPPPVDPMDPSCTRAQMMKMGLSFHVY